MNKAELVRAIALKSGLTQDVATKALNATIDAVSESLEKAEPVMLIGFGTFDVRQRSARTGRNPSTGAEIQIPASKNAGFKAGASLKARLN